MDLPKDHNLRKSLLNYKTRFEEFNDESLDPLGVSENMPTTLHLYYSEIFGF